MLFFVLTIIFNPFHQPNSLASRGKTVDNKFYHITDKYPTHQVARPHEMMAFILRNFKVEWFLLYIL